MSVEQARAFIEKVKNDEQLQNRLVEAQDTESKLEITKKEGYEFSVDDYKEAAEELSDADLEQLAGGKRYGECHVNDYSCFFDSSRF